MSLLRKVNQFFQTVYLCFMRIKFFRIGITFLKFIFCNSRFVLTRESLQAFLLNCAYLSGTVPDIIPMPFSVRCLACRFSFESAFAPFSCGTEFLLLSSLNPPDSHILPVIFIQLSRYTESIFFISGQQKPGTSRSR